MSATNDPAKSPAAARPAKTASAPAAPKAAVPTTFTRQLRRVDAGLVVLVLLLAFLLGSFLADNSSLSLHLGLANPFDRAATWPHHAWLPSLLLRIFYEPYAPSSALGGAIVVALKALVVVAVAGVLLLVRRPGQSLVLPLALAALAVLVMSPRLTLEPMVLSLLLLAVTLFLLTRPARTWPRALWFLPPLFALWVNLDQWFVLGPIVVGLFLGGEWLQDYLRLPRTVDNPKDPKRLKQLGITFGAGLAACLLNPWFFNGLALPPGLAYLLASTFNPLPGFITAGGTVVYKLHQQDLSFHAQLLGSPFSSDYWSRPSVGLNTAGLAYFLLLGASLVSYYLATARLKKGSTAPRPGLSVPLFAVLVFFALLSFTVHGLIPLFAVVAAPIAALNFQDYARRVWPPEMPLSSREQNWTLAGRALLGATVLLLAVCAWPGWLHANADDWRFSHRVRWQVLEDPGILHAANTLAKVQQHTGLGKVGLTYDPESGDQFIWPVSQGQVQVHLLGDTRYSSYAGQADAVAKIRKALRDEHEAYFGGQAKDRAEERARGEKLRQAQTTYVTLMRQLGIDHVIFTDCHIGVTQSKRLAEGLLRLPFMWTVLYYDGRTAIFGWRDPESKGTSPYEPMKLDLWRLTAPRGQFANLPQSSFDGQHVPPEPTAPPGGWALYFKGQPMPALAAFASEQYIGLHNLETEVQRYRFFTACLGTLGSSALAAELQSGNHVLKPHDLGPPGAALVGFRAARQAVVESPYNTGSYFQELSAGSVLKKQEDYWAVKPLPQALRVQYRQAVHAAALNHLEVLQPFNAQVQQLFLNMYFDMEYLDFLTEHFAKLQRSIDPSKMPDDKREEMGKQLENMNDAVKKKREAYKQFVTSDMDVLEKFNLLIYGPTGKPNLQPNVNPQDRLGLGKQAIKLLLDTKLDNLPPDKQQHVEYLRIALLLKTGQIKEAEARLTGDARKRLPGGQYEVLKALAAAVRGDYVAADRLLAEADKLMEPAPTGAIKELQRKMEEELALFHSARLAQIPLGLHALPPVRLALSEVLQGDTSRRLDELAVKAIRVGEARLLRGILALEVGNNAAAAEHFRAVLALVPPGLVFPDRAVAQRYVELLQ